MFHKRLSEQMSIRMQTTSLSLREYHAFSGNIFGLIIIEAIRSIKICLDKKTYFICTSSPIFSYVYDSTPVEAY